MTHLWDSRKPSNERTPFLARGKREARPINGARPRTTIFSDCLRGRIHSNLFCFLLLPWLFAICDESFGITILSEPSLTPATNAPLAGVLRVTTDKASRVSVSVNDGYETWERAFYDYDTSHSLILLGFKPNRTNEVRVTVCDALGNCTEASSAVQFVTGALPADFPKFVVSVSKPEKMEPGYTLLRIINQNGNKAYVMIVDNQGQVVWYSGIPSNYGTRQLSNGSLLYPLPTVFEEVNMLGQIVRRWPLPAGLPYNHDAFPTDHGTFLWLTDGTKIVTNFPTSATNPSAPHVTTNVWHNPVMEMSVETGQTVHSWTNIDILDPTRISYLTFSQRSVTLGWDWSHSNAVLEDTRDNSIIVSMRHQNAVIKFDRVSGALKWILGPHENWGPEFQEFLLTPVGAPFQWNYGQHAPMITPQGTLLLFDNGNFRASPFDSSVPDASNFSRAVEYSIDESKMEVSQVWEYGANIDEPIYAGSRGDANWLPLKTNVLITFADVSYVNGMHPSSAAPNARMVRTIEVTHEQNPEVVFDLAFFDYSNLSPTYLGCVGYRGERITDLYAHPARPVQDLVVSSEDGKSRLRFSGDTTRTYLVQASTDLISWEDIGHAARTEYQTYEFVDEDSQLLAARFYRVLTQ